MSGKIVKVSGPLVVAEGLSDAGVADIVRIGAKGLLGEILTMADDLASIQVYDETGGLDIGAEVVTTDAPLSVELGPGLLGNIYDGVQRPFAGTGIPSGGAFALNRTREWKFAPALSMGTRVTGGCVIGTVEENPSVSHKITVPLGVDGIIESIKGGSFTVEEPVCRIKTAEGTKDITLMQKWHARVSRPFKKKHSPTTPLCSGQRVIDTFFPIAKGGTAAISGSFGSGKTALLHQLARWADVDIIVYICCGERGNEMADLTAEFSNTKDPRSGEPLINRAVFIVSTSDMPIMSCDAAIYSGTAIAEYFRDMGYNVAVIADSASRWAEALREMSDHLGELPCEEGYPAYLASRFAQFYERAGVFECLGDDERLRGSLTVISSVSPPAGNTSDVVSQLAIRFAKSFLELDGSLACSRHFPAVNPLTSLSMYADTLESWFDSICGTDFMKNRSRAISLLREEAEIQETAELIGYNSLSDNERLTLDAAKMIREDFLQQDFSDESDSYSPYEKQYALLSLILKYNDYCSDAISKGVTDIQALFNIDAREAIARAKLARLPEFAVEYEAIDKEMSRQISEAISGGGEL